MSTTHEAAGVDSSVLAVVDGKMSSAIPQTNSTTTTTTTTTTPATTTRATRPSGGSSSSSMVAPLATTTTSGSGGASVRPMSGSAEKVVNGHHGSTTSPSEAAAPVPPQTPPEQILGQGGGTLSPAATSELPPPHLSIKSPTPVKGTRPATPPATTATPAVIPAVGIHRRPISSGEEVNEDPGAAPPSLPKSTADISSDLQYLTEQRVCQTLELIVKQLLRDRPADPTLAICNMLRGNNQNNPLRNSRSSLQLPPPARTPELAPESPTEREPGALPRRTVPTAKKEVAAASGGGAPQDSLEGSMNGGGALPAGGGVGRSQRRIGSGGASPTHSPTAAQVPGHPRPMSSGSTGSAHLFRQKLGRTSATPAQQPPGGNTSSSPPPPGVSGYRRESAGGTVGSASLHRPLERDESTKSEISVFSVNSVDMTEFITEFRAAHTMHFPHGSGLISRDDLAEIVDSVNLPLPDIRMLADLFAEIDSTESDLIKFDVFLARLGFKIQGRFQSDLIRAVYRSIGGHAIVSPTEGFQPRQHHSGGTKSPLSESSPVAGGGVPAAPRRTSLTTATATAGNPATAIPGSMSMNSLPSTPGTAALPTTSHDNNNNGGMNNVAMVSEVKGASSSAPPPLSLGGAALLSPTSATTATASPYHERLPVMRCLDEGIRAGLGLRISDSDFMAIIRRLGLLQQHTTQEPSTATTAASPTAAGGPASSGPEMDGNSADLDCHDFLRVVGAITGQQLLEEGDTASVSH